MALQVQVLHAESECLEEAQAAAIEQWCDQAKDAVELTDDLPDLVARQNHGQSRRRADACDDGKCTERLVDDMRVKEEQGRKGLILCGGADVVAGGERGEEPGNLVWAERGGVLHAGADDEATGPVAVRLFGAGGSGVVPGTRHAGGP